jgi:hypothetical protein
MPRTFPRAFLVPSLIALVAVSATACSRRGADLTDPVQIATDLRGTWSDTISYPGISTVFRLTVADTLVAGDGTYAIEAGRSGTLTVTGVISGSHVRLVLARDFGLITHFDGELTARNLLSGYGWSEMPYGQDPAPMGFKRRGD